KALLFLAAGQMSRSVDGSTSFAALRGVGRVSPLAYATFVIGAASLSGFPLVTAGFFSKDLIISHAWLAARSGAILGFTALLGSSLTALYLFRSVFLLTRNGRNGRNATSVPAGYTIGIPLVVLAVLSIVGGYVQIPHVLGGSPLLSEFLSPSLPPLGREPP